VLLTGVVITLVREAALLPAVHRAFNIPFFTLEPITTIIFFAASVDIFGVPVDIIVAGPEGPSLEVISHISFVVITVVEHPGACIVGAFIVFHPAHKVLTIVWINPVLIFVHTSKLFRKNLELPTLD